MSDPDPTYRTAIERRRQMYEDVARLRAAIDSLRSDQDRRATESEG